MSEETAARLERLADTIDSYCDHEDDDPGCLGATLDAESTHSGVAMSGPENRGEEAGVMDEQVGAFYCVSCAVRLPTEAEVCLRCGIEPFIRMGGGDNFMPAFHDLPNEVVVWGRNTGPVVTAGDVRRLGRFAGWPRASSAAVPGSSRGEAGTE